MKYIVRSIIAAAASTLATVAVRKIMQGKEDSKAKTDSPKDESAT